MISTNLRVSINLTSILRAVSGDDLKTLKPQAYSVVLAVISALLYALQYLKAIFFTPPIIHKENELSTIIFTICRTVAHSSTQDVEKAAPEKERLTSDDLKVKD